MAYRTSATVQLLIAVGLAMSGAPARASVIQLTSPTQLGPRAVTLSHTATVNLLPSPHVVSTADNVVTFTLAVGDWRRLDEGVNVVSDFSLGTHLLYTNNNNGVDLEGQGSIGGGGSGPVEIAFGRRVRAVGLRAQMGVLGLETLTFSAFDDLTILGTFSVTRVNGQHQDDSASFLGVRATGADAITRLTLDGIVTQGGIPHENDFFFGPVAYVAEPSTVLLCLAGLGLAIGRGRRR